MPLKEWMLQTGRVPALPRACKVFWRVFVRGFENEEKKGVVSRVVYYLLDLIQKIVLFCGDEMGNV